MISACIVGAVAFSLAAPQALAASNEDSTGSTADHSKFDSLDRKFESGPEVTRACLECHTEAAKQLHKTTHWTWEYKNPETNQLLGKKNVVNNFCIGTASNIQACASCHIGYG